MAAHLHGLGVHGDDDSELFGRSVEQESGHPEFVSHRDAFAGTDLELPLEEKRGTSNSFLHREVLSVIWGIEN